jgi:hypothetical protein
MIFTHVGGLTEEQILDMTYILYKDVLNELAIKFNYDCVVHILANPYAKDSNKIIDGSNPFNVSTKKKNKSQKLTLKDLADIGLDVPNN